MAKIVYNSCHGGFGLSKQAIELGRELSKNPHWGEDTDHIPRHNETLVLVAERLGENANAVFADLAIKEIPAGTEYRIDEYDGNERVMTKDDYHWEKAP